MACSTSNHILPKDEVKEGKPEVGAACECGKFIYLGNGFWHVAVTGRCPQCTHPFDDHGLCCGCTLRVG